MKVTSIQDLLACDEDGALFHKEFMQSVPFYDGPRGTFIRHYCEKHKRLYNSVTLDGTSPPYPRYYLDGRELTSYRGSFLNNLFHTMPT